MSVISGNISEDARKERALYMREWRKKNPEKQKEYEIRKWEKKAKERKAREEARPQE